MVFQKNQKYREEWPNFMVHSVFNITTAYRAKMANKMPQ